MFIKEKLACVPTLIGNDDSSSLRYLSTLNNLCEISIVGNA